MRLSTTGPPVHRSRSRGGRESSRSGTLGGVNSELARVLELHDGVATSAQLREVVPRWVLSHAVRTGALCRVYPGTYADPACLTVPATMRRAAIVYLGSGAALSHTSALATWGLPCDDSAAVHVTVVAGRSVRGSSRLVVHQRAGFAGPGLGPRIRDGLPVVGLDLALVESWPLLTGAARRAPLIAAIANQMTTPDRVRAATRIRALPDRARMANLIDLLAAGCRSELEIWGYKSVFTAVGMPRFQWQQPVLIGSRRIYLDLYAETERVNIELDGAKWHSSPRDRERDLRRDAALAARGILVVRFTHRQLQDPTSVRHQLRAILATRRPVAS